MTADTEELTPIDIAHAAMEAEGAAPEARLRFYERIADAELFLMLIEEAEGENISPELFELEEGRFVLAFDREERLAQFAERPAPYAALSGRILAEMLRGQEIGLGLNLGVAPSAILIPPAAMDWLCDTLGHAPEETEAQIAQFTAPGGLPEALITAIDTKLATAVGLAKSAYLVGTVDAAGGRGHLLGFVDALEPAQGALAKAASEALTFSGIEAGAMDVAFFAAADPVTARLAAVGLRFDLPEPAKPEPLFQEAPGSNPDKPPILK
ncbi:SseB family protein [Pseudodonghicola flavimaris]|uniref:SseB family protein n=1 Tax=Pseudodonghicola flavimaris TaxID=3050036 RepID=A0ABT7EYT9_9RHOB|nr:SseB family protein [Pseudodonghicola flavimaris]MDK3017513.1 SseB family protein [Pseudodonghicola flavimaris]